MNTLSLHPPKTRTMLGEAFVVALVIEAVVLFAIAGWLGHHESKPETKPLPPIRITMAAATPAPPAPKPAPPVPKPVVPHPQPVKQAPAKPRMQKVSSPAQLPKAAQPAEQADVPATRPAPVADKAPAVASPPVQPAASSTNAKPSAEFEAKLRDAVQAAVRYPSAARIMKLTGHVRLGFLYQDGTISNPRVVQSSGQVMLDKAALAALNDTSFPAPPAELKGHALNLEIVVTFSPSS
jgi:protein TonB